MVKNIETKYNIGNYVYFIKEGFLYGATIVKISIKIELLKFEIHDEIIDEEEFKKVSILYKTSDGYYYPENDISDTPQNLIKSLFSNFRERQAD
jgi:hypothetical protein